MAKPRTSKVVTTVEDQLPPDVVEILRKINPITVDAISHLARSYDAMMEDAGVGANREERTEEQVVDGAPSVGDIQRMLDQATQPRVGGEVSVRVHDKSLPRANDGLVVLDYLVASNPVIMKDLVRDEEWGENYDHRLQAIREVLSSLPEDAWNGANVGTLVDRAYNELCSGRRPIGSKT